MLVSREPEEAESVRFRFGDGTLFQVNLREQATLDCSAKNRAQAEYQRALAACRFSTASS
jgi:hypothetical protein